MSTDPLDPQSIRKDFPLIMGREVHGKPICYLDSAASSPKPQVVWSRVRPTRHQRPRRIR